MRTSKHFNNTTSFMVIPFIPNHYYINKDGKEVELNKIDKYRDIHNSDDKDLLLHAKSVLKRIKTKIEKKNKLCNLPLHLVHKNILYLAGQDIISPDLSIQEIKNALSSEVKEVIIYIIAHGNMNVIGPKTREGFSPEAFADHMSLVFDEVNLSKMHIKFYSCNSGYEHQGQKNYAERFYIKMKELNNSVTVSGVIGYIGEISKKEHIYVTADKDKLDPHLRVDASTIIFHSDGKITKPLRIIKPLILGSNQESSEVCWNHIRTSISNQAYEARHDHLLTSICSIKTVNLESEMKTTFLKTISIPLRRNCAEQNDHGPVREL